MQNLHINAGLCSSDMTYVQIDKKQRIAQRCDTRNVASPGNETKIGGVRRRVWFRRTNIKLFHQSHTSVFHKNYTPRSDRYDTYELPFYRATNIILGEYDVLTSTQRNYVCFVRTSHTKRYFTP